MSPTEEVLAMVMRTILHVTAALVLATGVGVAGEQLPGEARLDLVPRRPSAAAVTAPSFADLVAEVQKGVVRIETRTFVAIDPEEDELLEHPLLRWFRQEIGPLGSDPAEDRRIVALPSQGTGFFITEDGYLLTNKHVVEGADRIDVRLTSGRELPARLVGLDPHGDVALLRVEGGGPFPALPLGDSDALRVGEWVVAIGNPLDLEGSVTVGVVSAKNRSVGRGGDALGNFIQTDAAINVGNSGGPLLDRRGEVVGINSAIFRRGVSLERETIEGIGFALPITPIARLLPQLVATGTVRRGYLGVSLAPIDAEIAEWYGLERPSGALVDSVQDGYPAAAAGIEAGDVIVDIDGEPLRDVADLIERVSAYRPGDVVAVGLWRAHARREVTVELAARPLPPRTGQDDPIRPPDVPFPGLAVRELSDAQRSELAERGIDAPAGVVITRIDPTSDAARRGLAEGWILHEIDGRPISDTASYERAVAAVTPGSVVRVVVTPVGRRGSGRPVFRFFRAPPARSPGPEGDS